MGKLTTEVWPQLYVLTQRRFRDCYAEQIALNACSTNCTLSPF